MGLSRDRTTLEQEAIDRAKAHNGLSCEPQAKRLNDISGHSLTIGELPIHPQGSGTQFVPGVKLDPINHPPHYNNSEAKCSCGRRIECIDVTRHLNFNIGNAMKYLWRCDFKGVAVEDLKKALWYINDEIEQRAKR